MNSQQRDQYRAQSHEATRIFEAARKLMKKGNLGKFESDNADHIEVLRDASRAAVRDGRTKVTVEDMNTAEMIVDARKIQRLISDANNRLEDVERQWEADCQRRAAM